jgi:glycerol-3-phosphate dehydrogenase (NAD(P)+)
LATVLAKNDHVVRIWSRGREVADAINKHHENKVYRPGIKLDASIAAVTDMQSALAEAEFVVAVVPSHAMRETADAAARFVDESAVVVSASKGIEDDSLKTMFHVLADVLGGPHRIGVISGPSFATEVAAGVPTVVVAAATEQRVAERVQRAFATDRLRVYSSTDITGVEIGGVVKNVMAIATGASDGLRFGHNARAATITRGLAEITRLAVALGARKETLYGLSGLGDLVLTCTGDLSRNRQLGLRLGRGEQIDDILSGMRMVAEGVRNTKVVNQLAERNGVEMPIVHATYKVLYEGLPPQEVLRELFGRPLKPEFY